MSSTSNMPPLPASPKAKVIEYCRTNIGDRGDRTKRIEKGDYYVAEWNNCLDIKVGDKIVETTDTEDSDHIVRALVVTKVARVNYWIDGDDRPQRKSKSTWRLVDIIDESDIDDLLVAEAKSNNSRIRYCVKRGMIYA